VVRNGLGSAAQLDDGKMPPALNVAHRESELARVIQSANDHAADGPLVKRERLGGLLDHYYKKPRDFGTIQ
jgi:hypothetical protein